MTIETRKPFQTRTPIRAGATGFYVSRPGRAADIHRNGWSCSASRCRRAVTVEIGWWEPSRGPLGYSRVKQGACEPCAAEFERAFSATTEPQS